MEDMYGWRGRFGHVCPGLHDTQGFEFHRLLPKGVMVVSTTLTVQKLAESDLEQAFSLMEQGAIALAREEVGAIIIGGDPIFSQKGIGSHQQMIDSVYGKTGIPTSTTISASMDALRLLKVKRLALATPFAPERDAALCRYLEGSGFEVLAVQGLGISRNVEFTRVPFQASYQVAAEAFRKAKQAEGIYISCPRWPVVMNLDSLEKDFGVPVVASTQAMAWFGLKSLGIKDPIRGYGKLLEMLAHE